MAKSNLRASAIYLAGLMARGMGYPELASRAIGNAAAINPENPSFHYELGVARMKSHLLDEAEVSFRRALDLRPDMAAAYSGLGDVFRVREKLDDAITQYEKALSLDPENAQAHFGIGLIRSDQYRLEEAAAHFRRAIELDPGLFQAGEYLDEIISLRKNLRQAVERLLDVAYDPSCTETDQYRLSFALYRAAAAGMRDWAIAMAEAWAKKCPQHRSAAYTMSCLVGKDAPPIPPDGYIERLFDCVAEGFDENLYDISYRGPDMVARLIASHFPAQNLDVLDAGCGTGLDAAALKPYARTLAGVDVSSKMLETAKKHGMYDHLYKSDILSFLRVHPASYDLIAASDVFCYFGDLSDVLFGMSDSLRKGGRVAFTVEHDGMDSAGGWRLQASGRYCHTESYVRNKVKEAGLTLVAVEAGLLRQELLQNVEGLAVLARKES